MKQDVLSFCFKLFLLVALITACVLWGLHWVWYVVGGLLGVGLLLYLCSLWVRIKHAVTYIRPLRHFVDAVKHDDTAVFEKLLQHYMPTWRSSINDSLRDDVFDAVVRADSMPLMRSLLQQETASWWQEHLSTVDLLCHTVLHGSPQMLRFLIEQGMRPEQEWESPWLIALINARIDHARVLHSLGFAIITPVQQERSAWPPLALMLTSPAAFPSPAHYATVRDFLKEIAICRVIGEPQASGI